MAPETQVLVNLAARQRDRRGAHLGEDVAAETRDAELEPLEVVDRVHFLSEPAAHLHSRGAADEALDSEFGAEFVPELLAAHPPDPGVALGGDHPEGNRREVREARMLALPVVLGSVIDVRVSGRDLVERVKRLDPLAGGEVLHVQPAVGHVGEALREALRVRAERREVPRPRADHHDLLATLGDCGRRDGCGRDASGADRSFLQEFPSLHAVVRWLRLLLLHRSSSIGRNKSGHPCTESGRREIRELAFRNPSRRTMSSDAGAGFRIRMRGIVRRFFLSDQPTRVKPSARGSAWGHLVTPRPTDAGTARPARRRFRRSPRPEAAPSPRAASAGS